MTPKQKKIYGPVHPWRLCPLGQFYRIAHKQGGYARADGTPVRGSHHRATCVKNRSGLDQIYTVEMSEIAERYFSSLSGAPKADPLGYPRGNEFDSLIRGWTRYWNEVLGGADPLDPNLNIAAGIRWLFRKREIARSKLGRKASWRDAIAEFKDYDNDPNHSQMLKFDEHYERLKKR